MSKMASLLYFLFLYIHLTACIIYYVASLDKKWTPNTDRYSQENIDFYSDSVSSKYINSIYASMMVLIGSDIYPQTDQQIAVNSLLTICGALILANIFGTITFLVQALNQKNQHFQQTIDRANTSMYNMRLPLSLQEEVRHFMVLTQNNLDNQKEINFFLQTISPSLRNKVTTHIFLDAVRSNPILSGSQKLTDFLVNEVKIYLYMPEDTIVN